MPSHFHIEWKSSLVELKYVKDDIRIRILYVATTTNHDHLTYGEGNINLMHQLRTTEIDHLASEHNLLVCEICFDI